jgi:hypothetical protein
VRSSGDDTERAMLSVACRIAGRFNVVPVRVVAGGSSMVEIRVEQGDAVPTKETDQANNSQPARYPSLNHGDQDSRPTLYLQCIYNVASRYKPEIANGHSFALEIASVHSMAGLASDEDPKCSTRQLRVPILWPCLA